MPAACRHRPIEVSAVRYDGANIAELEQLTEDVYVDSVAVGTGREVERAFVDGTLIEPGQWAVLTIDGRVSVHDHTAFTLLFELTDGGHASV